MTQEELAQRADVNRTDISRFEHGENVTMKTFLRIVQAIPDLKELSIGELRLHNDGPPVPEQADVMQMMAGALQQSIAGQAKSSLEPSQIPPGNGESPRELVMLRAFAKFLLEIAGGYR